MRRIKRSIRSAGPVDVKLGADVSYQLAEVVDMNIDQGTVSGALREGSLARRQPESLI